MLMAFAHLTTSMPPACSWHHQSFVYMHLDYHGIRSPQNLYVACMLMTPSIICSIFCLSNPILYTPACSRSLPTSLPLYRLHAHDTGPPLPLQHRLRIYSTRPIIKLHHNTIQTYHHHDNRRLQHQQDQPLQLQR